MSEVKPRALMVKPVMSRVEWLPLNWVRSKNPVKVFGILVLATDTASALPAMGESSSMLTSSLPLVLPLPSETSTSSWNDNLSSRVVSA
ncbi:hypothetical protein D3C85_1555060 [compost metagenome]